MDIKDNMDWPPMDLIYHKMQEHSVWYSGSPEAIANFYSLAVNNEFIERPFDVHKETFWGRQIKNQGETFVHVPIANDIAETSSNLIFGESPIIRIGDVKKDKEAQKTLEKMLSGNNFHSKIIEAAESCAAIGGIYIAIAWDKELSEYPIPIIWQADYAIPTFKYGILFDVTFWSTIKEENEKRWRLLEKYEKGSITYKLYLGRADKLGKEVDLKSIEETADLVDITLPDILPVAYIPNVLPNRLSRMSYHGRSDLLGIEGMMDALDEIYSMWCREITIAQARVLMPESYLRNLDGTKGRFNPDTMIYVGLDVDPVSDNKTITPQQFEIRANEFEKSALNYIERIVVSAGYSPQSFGLSIQGRAESGLALQLRERKSFSTKSKKEKYWDTALKHLMKCMMMIYKTQLGGKIDPELEVSVSFSDGIMNDFSEISDAVVKISNAIAASVDTKVRMLHPDWDETQIEAEVKLIMEENNIGAVEPPDGNLDLSQMNLKGKKSPEETKPVEGDPNAIEQ